MWYLAVYTHISASHIITLLDFNRPLRASGGH